MATSVKDLKTALINAHKQVNGLTSSSTEISLHEVVESLQKGPQGYKEKFFDTLYEMRTSIKVLDNKPFTSVFDEIGYVDSDEWAGAIELVSIIPPEIKETTWWQDFVSGETKLHDTPVFFPSAKMGFAQLKGTWSQPWAYSTKQLQKACMSPEDLIKFTVGMDSSCNDNVETHKDDLARLSFLNFLGLKKVAFDKSIAGNGVIDFVALYYGTVKPIATGETKTLADFMADPEARNWYMGFLNKLVKMFKCPTRKYSVAAGKDVWTDYSDMVYVGLTDFENSLKTIALNSVAYDEEIRKLGVKRYDVPYWQSSNEDTIAGMSHVKVKVDWNRGTTGEIGTTTTQTSAEITNLCGVLLDERALMHTLISDETVSDYDSFKKLTAYERGIEDMHINALNLNAVLLVGNSFTMA